MSRRHPARTVPEPLEAPLTPVAITGTVLWLIGGSIALFNMSWLQDNDALWWLWVCLIGVGLGLAGMIYSLRHDARRQTIDN